MGVQLSGSSPFFGTSGMLPAEHLGPEQDGYPSRGRVVLACEPHRHGERYAQDHADQTQQASPVQRRLGLHEAQFHEVAGGVVHVDQEGAPGRSVLEPFVVATIDLDRLAEARPAVAPLVGAPHALATRQPDPGRCRPLAERLAAHVQVMPLEQLLAREHRPEVGVVLPDERDGASPEFLGQPPVARPAAPTGGETAWARLLKGPAQPPHLADTHADFSPSDTLRQRPTIPYHQTP